MTSFHFLLLLFSSHMLLRAVKDSLTENTTNVVWARVAGVMPAQSRRTHQSVSCSVCTRSDTTRTF